MIFTLEHGSQKPIISYRTKYQDRTHNIKLITITDGTNCHYLAVNNIPKLLRGSTKHNGDYYCTRCISSFRTKNGLDEHIPICKDFGIVLLKCLLKMLIII